MPGGIAFCYVKGSYRAIPASQGKINRESMAVWGDFFHRYHSPVLSAGQNEELNVIDQSQAENRPVSVQEIS